MNLLSQRTLVGLSLTVLLTIGAGGAMAQVAPPPADRMPQPMPPPSAWTRTDSADGMTTYYTTPTSNFPESDPWVNPTNLLPTVYADVLAANGVPIPNTLPSTPEHPYNLHDDPVVQHINGTSPADDLAAIFQSWYRTGPGQHEGEGSTYDPRNFSRGALQRGIDILEGNPVPDRVYSGMPMLHYNAPSEVGQVVPTYDSNGNPIGGNVTVHQVWFGQHIESDTAFIDPSAMLAPALRNLPWTITYVVDTLHRGNDDFSPMEMFFDDPDVLHTAKPLVMMDATFYPILDGTRTTFVIKEPPARFFNLVYTWGWRNHPGRVQVMENGLKTAMGKTLVQWEVDTFGADPRASNATKQAAIAMIGDLSPAKRMWNALRKLQAIGYNPRVMAEYERAFHQWQQRNQLPDGVTPDKSADYTLFYVNNTIYGQMSNMARFAHHPTLEKWHLRGTQVTVKLINGDYFPHGYVSVDFGGLRGWENTFQNTIPLGGDGAWFTFGRDYWEPNTPTPAMVPPAVKSATAEAALPAAARARMASLKNRPVENLSVTEDKNHSIFRQREEDPDAKSWPASMPSATFPTSNGDVLGEHTVVMTLNYEPSKRLRIYQFDPLHHDEAIWSIH
ncbi:MAG: hypothetical protein KGJ32_03735 [Xanthomonadaceae bacterium]|nr:hypothetical protein [Xanthomonadaceae bacterium]